MPILRSCISWTVRQLATGKWKDFRKKFILILTSYSRGIFVEGLRQIRYIPCTGRSQNRVPLECKSERLSLITWSVITPTAVGTVRVWLICMWNLLAWKTERMYKLNGWLGEVQEWRIHCTDREPGTTEYTARTGSLALQKWLHRSDACRHHKSSYSVPRTEGTKMIYQCVLCSSSHWLQNVSS